MRFLHRHMFQTSIRFLRKKQPNVFSKIHKRFMRTKPMTSPRISGIRTHGIRKELTVKFEDGSYYDFDYFWLRDNDPATVHPKTFQRLSDTSSISLNILAQDVRHNGDSITIDWKDEVTSVYPKEFFHKFIERSLHPIRHPSSDTSIMWSGNTWSSLCSMPIHVDFHKLMSEDSEVSNQELTQLLESIFVYGFAIVQNTPPTGEDTKRVSDKIGLSRQTIFGNFWNYEVVSSVQEDILEHNDTAYTSLDIKCHTDGTYYESPPGLQVFHCLSHDGTGGNNLLMDGFYLGELLKENEPKVFKYLTTQDIEFHYTDETYNFRWSDKVFKLDSKGAFKAFRFNNHDRCAPNPLDTDCKLYHYSIQTLQNEIESPDNAIEMKLLPGMVLITNNWRVLHGRKMFTGKRRMAGSYIDYDIFLNKYRSLRKY